MLKYWPFYIWLIYLIWPYDLVPDFLPGAGWIEDALLLGLLYWFFVKKRPDLLHKVKAAATTGDFQGLLTWSKSSEHSSNRLLEYNGKNPHQILDVPRSASLAEIKQAYRAKAARYHPDKVTHLGDELQSLAREKFHEIQWAYDRLTETKNDRKG